MPTAILIDGGFFIRRFPRVYRGLNQHDPKLVADTLVKMSSAHLWQAGGDRRQLYRIFFYDCPPVLKKAHQPVSNRAIDFSKTPTATFRLALHEELRGQRKLALRLGHLSHDAHWTVDPGQMKALLRGKIDISDLTDDDFFYDVRQKGVDMRVGLDIASLAFKKQVDQIVLVAGDADFVPAAKLARREGIDFVLDPMWNPIHPYLKEHIDGLRSTCPNPSRAAADSANVRPTELQA